MDRKKLLRILKNHGYELIRNSKHSIYSNGKNSIAIPSKHKMINKILAERILKELGIDE